MLPILRIVPVGGVLLAILILVLALTPPDRSHRSLSPTMVMARGPLLDRGEHPEWRQFLILAALRRADELNRLRELPDTPLRIGPVAPETDTHNEPVASAPSEPVSGGSTAPENVQPANAQTESAQPGSAPPESAEPATAQAPIAEPAPAPAPADSNEDTPKLFAGLPADPTPDDVTGSIDESPGATIPIDIGETSSTELPVVLPEERPPVIRTPERAKPAHESRRKHVRRVRQAKLEPAPPAPLNFFELIFGRVNTPPPQARVAARKVTARKSAQKAPPAAAKRTQQARAAAN